MFPGVVLPKPDYEVFMEVLNENIKKMKLQPVPWFIGKIIQVGSLHPYRGAPVCSLKSEIGIVVDWNSVMVIRGAWIEMEVPSGLTSRS